MRGHRRLLWAYPPAYRAEIMTTLLEMAEDGYGPPGRIERLHLVACGLRQRFRVPLRRPLAVIAAVLAAVAMGALGATAGTWAGWQTAAPVPSDRQVRELVASAAAYDPATVAVEPWATAMNGPVKGVVVNGSAPHDAERFRAALIADGWRFTFLAEEPGRVVVDFETEPWTTVPSESLMWRASKGGLRMGGSTLTMTGRESSLGMNVWADDNGLIRPFMIAGLAGGMLAGWLLVAGLVRGGRRVAVFGAVALGSAAVPVFDLLRNAFQVLVYDPAMTNPYVVDDPGSRISGSVVLLCTVISVVAAIPAVLVRGGGKVPGMTRQEAGR